MKNLKYSKSNADKVSIKGTVTDGGKSIIYEDDEKNMAVFNISNCMKLFVDQEVTFTVSTKNDVDCTGDLVLDEE